MAQASQVAARPFLAETIVSRETLKVQTVTPGASEQSFVVDVPAKGFLRGINLNVSSSGGALGGGSLLADAPFNIFSSITLETPDGAPIIGPFDGFTHYLVQKFTRPFAMNPKSDPIYTASENPVFNLPIFVESHGGLGCLVNTDARAQYRLKFTISTLAAYITGGSPTAPTLTITPHIEYYMQPAMTTLMGQPINPIPEGINVQRNVVAQSGIATTSGAYTLESRRTGNHIRTLLVVFRNSSAVRTNLTGDPIRLRVDNSQLLIESRQENIYHQNNYLSGNYGQTLGSETGVYAWTFNHSPGAMEGAGWLATTPATALFWEVNGAPSGGTAQIITEDLSQVSVGGQIAPVPALLDSV